MSEYQYYEFQAIDQPLDEKAIQALRNLSPRAQISSTSFVNEYNWGDFKGNPLKLMERYNLTYGDVVKSRELFLKTHIQ